MRTQGQTIAKNVSVMMVSQLITWALTLALTVVLPRYLGPGPVGQFYVANAIWAIAGMLASFGTDTLIIKLVARQADSARDLVGAAFVMRVATFLASCVFVGVYLWLLDYSAETLIVVAIVGGAQFVLQLSTVCMAVLQGLEKMEYVSLGTIAGKAVSTGVSLLLVALGYGVYAIAAVAMLSALTMMLPQFIAIWRQVGIRFHTNLRPAIALVRDGFPYMISGLTLVVYLQVHSLIISMLVSVQAVGWYSSAVQLYGTLMFVPVVLATAVFPSITRAHVNDQGVMAALVRRSFDTMLVISMPIGLGLAVIADPLVKLLFGEAFAPSGPILAVFGVALVFTYLNTLLGQLLISVDRQNIWTAVMVGATVLTIALDTVLVPLCEARFQNGAIGGAISFLITELLMTAVAIAFLPRGTLSFSNARTAGLTTGAGLIMAAATWVSRDFMIVVPVAVGAVVYITLVLLLRLIPPEDLQLVARMVANGARRFRRVPDPLGANGGS